MAVAGTDNGRRVSDHFALSETRRPFQRSYDLLGTMSLSVGMAFSLVNLLSQVDRRGFVG